jgi:hypothetical protein
LSDIHFTALRISSPEGITADITPLLFSVRWAT